MNHYCLALAQSCLASKAISPKAGLLFERSSQAVGQYQGGFIERDQRIPQNRL